MERRDHVNNIEECNMKYLRERDILGELAQGDIPNVKQLKELRVIQQIKLC